MMYQIDLLKGQGVPPRPRPLGIALSVATVGVPAVAMLLLSGWALSIRIDTSIAQRELTREVAALDELAGALNQRKSLQARKADATLGLREVKDLLASHTRWSAVLEAIAEHMPPSLTLTSVVVRQDQVRTIRSGPTKAGKTAPPTPARRMEIRLSDEGQPTGGEDVRAFRDLLYRCPAMESRLEPIEVTQEPGRIGDRNVTTYQLNCTFEERP